MMNYKSDPYHQLYSIGSELFTLYNCLHGIVLVITLIKIEDQRITQTLEEPQPLYPLSQHRARNIVLPIHCYKNVHATSAITNCIFILTVFVENSLFCNAILS